MKKYFVIVWLFVFSLMMAYLAFAQTDEANLPPEAKQAMTLGLESAKQQNWDLAIQHFKEAQKLAPTSAQALFNLALANDRAGGRELVASALYRAYLLADKDAPNAKEIKARIKKLDAQGEVMARKLLSFAEKGMEGLPDAAICPMCRSADAQRLKPGWMGISYRDIAFAQVLLGDFDKARKSLKKAIEFSDKDLNENTQVANYVNISETQIYVGDIEGALQTVNKIPYSDSGKWSSWKSEPLVKLVYYFMDKGDMERAKKITSGVKEKEIREKLQYHIDNYTIKKKGVTGANLDENKDSERIEFLVSLFPVDSYSGFTDFKSFMESLKKVDEDDVVLTKLIYAATELSSVSKSLRTFDQAK
jgi:tetratricopeptide (TPR) repeat protein